MEQRGFAGMRIVLDTNALLSAFIWENSVARKVLYKLAVFKAGIFASMKVITPVIKLDIVKDDPDDNKIIECAVASQSDFILSYNLHLLNLKEYAGIKIIRPDRFLISL
ncbi:MAG: hypothetical protein QME12_02745 [Nanoarchaeota archaeon]|nr:hypothetical protein [Nanoarchaeota archaeon]